MNIWSLFKSFYYRALPPDVYARKIGVNLGENCFIDTRKWSSEPYLIKIGNNVQITQDVYFHTHGGAHTARQKYKSFDIFGKIEIKDWAYIGSGSHIMPGITIGEGSLIAAGSIVTKSVPPHEVWGGNPARKICSIEDYINRNLPYNVDSKAMTSKQKKEFLLSLSEKYFIKK